MLILRSFCSQQVDMQEKLKSWLRELASGGKEAEFAQPSLPPFLQVEGIAIAGHLYNLAESERA